jgi:hypothetical protein
MRMAAETCEVLRIWLLAAKSHRKRESEMKVSVATAVLLSDGKQRNERREGQIEVVAKDKHVRIVK